MLHRTSFCLLRSAGSWKERRKWRSVFGWVGLWGEGSVFRRDGHPPGRTPPGMLAVERGAPPPGRRGFGLRCGPGVLYRNRAALLLRVECREGRRKEGEDPKQENWRLDINGREAFQSLKLTRTSSVKIPEVERLLSKDPDVHLLTFELK
ncbi:hypothetical protein JRQ81_003543 [Phrynocephalus forsythii]|uniref:Uncharacterized protein n=1 Tax=Phrynocephalus forsythii TaxID=171643 RepID=A0A9Q0XKT6_9SAUR|nr:hypothetical protein JRQ81_003543 [Phrynocephalus forsythii]